MYLQKANCSDSASRRRLRQLGIRRDSNAKRGRRHGPRREIRQNDIVPVKAELLYSTLIVLPENEEILDFTTGDKDYWIINGAHNLCYIHPAQAVIRSNLKECGRHGHDAQFQQRLIRLSPAPPKLAANRTILTLMPPFAASFFWNFRQVK